MCASERKEKKQMKETIPIKINERVPWRWMALLTVLSLALRLYRIDWPQEVMFDEVGTPDCFESAS